MRPCAPRSTSDEVDTALASLTASTPGSVLATLDGGPTRDVPARTFLVSDTS